ncbi:MAG: mucin-2 protein, partial [Nocardioides sp.]|uniref:mucin-2 protein n=1 Tax=Nocardioides sp. TaxID=35761 RepID=UPI0039E58D8C
AAAPAAADAATVVAPSVSASPTADVARGASLSRSQSRRVAAAITGISALSTTTKWTTTTLNLWSGAGDDATAAGEVADLTKIQSTGVTRNGRVQVVVDGKVRWVTEGYLADEKPAGISMEPCPDSSVEKGLKASTIKVYRSVCHAFPEITSYGGWAARSEHNTGNALDVMTSDKALGDRIAAWARAHAAELDLYDVIWWDRIWTPVRSSEGWRDYGDHGGATANHMDHVHIGTNP